MQVGPELIPLGSDAVFGVFNLPDGGIYLVIDDGFGSVANSPALDEGAEAEVAVFVVEEEVVVEKADFFEHGGGIE